MRARSGIRLVFGVVLALAALQDVPAAGGTVIRLGSVTIYPPEEVAAMCDRTGGGARLEFPGCRPWSLAREESLYSPMPVDEVVMAVRQIDFPLDGLPIDIVILPAPRLDLQASSAEGRVVLLSPARYGYPQEHIHYIVAHEIGHVLHHLLLPNPGDDLWRRYASIRGIDIESAREALAHAERIDEMFAEDFRVLFGGDLARCGAGVENHRLADPGSVAGLEDFFLSIPGAWENRLRLYASPNPFVEQVQVEAFALDHAAGVDKVAVYDIQGRLLRDLGPKPGAAAPSAVTWDGTLESGGQAAPGVYYAVITSGTSTGIARIVRAAR